MQLYRVIGRIDGIDGFVVPTDDSEEERDSLWRAIKRKTIAKTQAFNDSLGNNAFVFPVSIDHSVVIGIIIKGSAGYKSLLNDYQRKTEMLLADYEVIEVTISRMVHMLRSADREKYIEDDDEVLSRFNIDSLFRSRYIDINEHILDPQTKSKLSKKAACTLAEQSLLQELDRIYQGSKTHHYYGHPVQYLVRSNDLDTCSDIADILASALINNHRIRNRRISTVSIDPYRDEFHESVYHDLYAISYGGIVVLQFEKEEDCMDDHAAHSVEIIEGICDMMKKYHNDVLTILCLPRDNSFMRSTFYENTGTLNIVELAEEPAHEERAVNFLKRIASEHKVPVDNQLFSVLDSEVTYVSDDLHRIYDDWYSRKLKTEIYPQYEEVQSAKSEASKTAAKGSAYEQLMELIGLESAKKVIRQALDYKKAQKIFADRGMHYSSTSMHMVFTGNPGTAKTTVARLYARIMKDNGILSKGNLVEVGRGDIVGKYVGWTAPTIQKKFKEATGGVLFIDEAYSLVDDRSGSYGDEAINTIVQEMENHRDDVMVIFAGYPDKMEEFLQKNPGMRSRIAYHVSFEDYTTDELVQIAKLLAQKKDFHLTAEACDKLGKAFETARKQTDFGNGRYVRNIMEKAGMAQASRLLHEDYESLTDADIHTLLAEDFDITPIERKTAARIGF